MPFERALCRAGALRTDCDVSQGVELRKSRNTQIRGVLSASSISRGGHRAKVTRQISVDSSELVENAQAGQIGLESEGAQGVVGLQHFFAEILRYDRANGRVVKKPMLDAGMRRLK